MSGFAVIDLKTTGFAYNATDRVCEIGVVLVDGAVTFANARATARSTHRSWSL
jgi:DNA polymerase III epsilon subunit-like protein